jgi:hypothetical protein
MKKTDKLYKNFASEPLPISKIKQLNKYIGHHIEFAIVDRQIMSNLEIRGFDIKCVNDSDLGFSFEPIKVSVFPVDYFEERNYKSIFSIDFHEFFSTEKELATFLCETAKKFEK